MSSTAVPDGNSSTAHAPQGEFVYRRALKVAVCALCSEVGFGSAEDGVIETLSEMLQSCKLICNEKHMCRQSYLSVSVKKCTV